MTKILDTDSAEIEVFSADEKKEAKEIAKQVGQLLDEIEGQEHGLARNFASLGVALAKVQEKKFWLIWGFQNFGGYLETIKSRVDKGRTQLYQIKSVAEKLLPAITEDQLVEMGLSKALELKRVVSQTGKNPSQELIEKAVDNTTTVQDLREAIFQETNVAPQHAGTYMDLGGAYFTAEERDVVRRAFDVATKIDPVIGKDVPEHIRRKEIILRLAQEFLATYEHEVLHG